MCPVIAPELQQPRSCPNIPSKCTHVGRMVHAVFDSCAIFDKQMIMWRRKGSANLTLYQRNPEKRLHLCDWGDGTWTNIKYTERKATKTYKLPTPGLTNP